jgi:hypothetical protein
MKSCTKCKHADWYRRADGSLHPSGDGQCLMPYKVPPLPASMWWIGSGAPEPSGGAINRRKELRDHCTYWTHA